MVWKQTEIILSPKSRGFYLITDEIIEQLPTLGQIEVGLLHLFLQHTSASISINENADKTVRLDMEGALARVAPENHPSYRHTFEGSDDMPAHIKSGLLGVSLSIPITNGELALGVWQGIWLGEHREYGGG